jgi:hypothetical protein
MANYLVTLLHYSMNTCFRSAKQPKYALLHLWMSQSVCNRPLNHHRMAAMHLHYHQYHLAVQTMWNIDPLSLIFHRLHLPDLPNRRVRHRSMLLYQSGHLDDHWTHRQEHLFHYIDRCLALHHPPQLGQHCLDLVEWLVPLHL